ncbi:MAG: hypothetical protein WC489_07450, partial [Patescibacteria group bacterium]
SLIGYYIVCTQKGVPFNNSDDGTPNCVYLRLKFWKRNILYTFSKDFDKIYKKTWKTWEGKINLDADSRGHGSGYYLYEDNNEPGIHEIFLKEKNTIIVRISDLGKANLGNKTDNEPSTQLWEKIEKQDPIYKKVKERITA